MYPPFSRGHCVTGSRSEEHTSELQSQSNLVCRLLLEKKKNEIVSSHAGAAAAGPFSSRTAVSAAAVRAPLRRIKRPRSPSRDCGTRPPVVARRTRHL